MARWVDLIHHSQHRICGMRYPKSDPSPHTSPRVASRTDSNYAADETASNWAGYEVTNGGLDWAWANWYVPLFVNPSPLDATATQWVGLGGDYGENLWQAGTETDDQIGGFYFWWEEVYANQPCCRQQYQGPTIGWGDLVRVGLDYGQTCAGQSYIQMADYTRNEYWSPNCQTFQPGADSAEWIDERTSCGTFSNGDLKLWKLADFQQTNWSYAQAESTRLGNTIEPISYFAHASIEMDDLPYSYTPLATPSGLGGDGMSFTDTWAGSGTSTCG